MRGRMERKAMMAKAAKTPPVLSTATTPATESRPRTEGQESSSGGEEHMVMATLRGPRILVAKNADATMEMAPMEESVDFEDSVESVIGSSVDVHVATTIVAVPDPFFVASTPIASTPIASAPIASTPKASTPKAKPYKTPPKPIVPISPDTSEEECPSPIPVARRRTSTKAIEIATSAASHPSVVATPKTQEEMDFDKQMLEAHRVLEGEMEKLKGAMEKERERQRERVRERMREKQRESREEDASAGKKEVGPVVFYPTKQVASKPKAEVRDQNDGREQRAMREKIEVKSSQIAKKEERREKKPLLPSFSKPQHAPVLTTKDNIKGGGKKKESMAINEMPSNSSGTSTNTNSGTTITASSNAEIKKVKRDMINAKIKYTQSLKKVLAKEQNLSKKEGELKKKEERVTKLADNLRRQRVTLKKEILKAKKPSELVKQIAELTPVKPPLTKVSKSSPTTKSSPSPKASPNRFNGSNVMKAPRLSMTERGAAKMDKLMSVYAGTVGSVVGDNYQSRDLFSEQPPTASHEGDEDMRAYRDKFLSGKAFGNNMGLMGLMEDKEEEEESKGRLRGPPTKTSQPLSVSSPSPKFSAYKAPNPLLQPPPSTIGTGPLSLGSAFGMNEPDGGMVKIWTDEYNKEMKRRMEEATGQGVGLDGVRSLSMVKAGTDGPVRSSSARINDSKSGTAAADNQAENMKEDSESSRESRSAPDERRSMHTSLDLLIGKTESVASRKGKESIKRGGGGKKKRNEQKGKAKVKSGNGNVGGIVKRESRMIRGRSKKRTPTKTLGRIPLGNIKKTSTSPNRREPSVSQEDVDKAKGNLNHILARKRMPLTDVIKSSSGNFIQRNKLRQELEEIMGDYGFGHSVEGIMEVAKKCVSADYAGSVDLKSLERSCRAAEKGGKYLSKGVAGGISTKGKAKQVYDGFRFSFEGSTEKENVVSDHFDSPRMDVATEEGKGRQVDGTKFPWLASFDQRMSEAIKQAGDGYMD